LDSAYNKLEQKLRHAFIFHEQVFLPNPLPVNGASNVRWETQNPNTSFEQFFQSYVRQYLVTYTLEMFENTEVIVDHMFTVYYDIDRNPSIDLRMRELREIARY
jgi:hypothetical protein